MKIDRFSREYLLRLTFYPEEVPKNQEHHRIPLVKPTTAHSLRHMK